VPRLSGWVKINTSGGFKAPPELSNGVYRLNDYVVLLKLITFLKGGE